MGRAGRSDGQVQSAVREVAGRRVWPVALGGAALSLRPDLSRETAAATINAAIGSGVNLIDTARAYTTADEEAHNERLIGDVLAARQDGSSVMVVTKGGHVRAGPAEWRNGARPAALRVDVERSLRALRWETVDLYFLHWPDAEVPFAESVGALGELRAEGSEPSVYSTSTCHSSPPRARSPRSTPYRTRTPHATAATTNSFVNASATAFRSWRTRRCKAGTRPRPHPASWTSRPTAASRRSDCSSRGCCIVPPSSCRSVAPDGRRRRLTRPPPPGCLSVPTRCEPSTLSSAITGRRGRLLGA